MYTISDVSEIMGISAHTLRFYDNEGLIPGLTKGVNNIRLFSIKDMEWVYIVQCLRRTGMPIAEIRRYIEACHEGITTVGERYDMLMRQRKQVKKELKEVKERLKTLQCKTDYYQALLNGGNPDSWNPDIPNLIKKAQRSPKAKL